MDAVLFSFLAPTPFQIVIVLILGVLFFGKNLPEVAKQVGSIFGELRKGLNEFTSVSKGILDGKELNSLQEDIFEDKPAEDKYKTAGTKFVPPSE
ncbi:hypothetical protein FACS189427_00160 [Planctomycetales bacterium]|nr:hypothetical protein FACS189427_00160 [Planctomycetales bacterium]